MNYEHFGELEAASSSSIKAVEDKRAGMQLIMPEQAAGRLSMLLHSMMGKYENQLDPWISEVAAVVKQQLYDPFSRRVRGKAGCLLTQAYQRLFDDVLASKQGLRGITVCVVICQPLFWFWVVGVHVLLEAVVEFLPFLAHERTIPLEATAPQPHRGGAETGVHAMIACRKGTNHLCH